MRINKLEFENIGPFKEASLDFRDEEGNYPMIIFTGENGTGKTIVIDAIRAMFLGSYGKIERNIVRNNTSSFGVNMNFTLNKNEYEKTCNELKNGKFNIDFSSISNAVTIGIKDKLPEGTKYDWMLDYWTSKLATDNFDVRNLVFPEPNKYLIYALDGIHRNTQVVELITFFDYLKDSEDQTERKLGEFLYETLKEIIKLSLNDGELKHVQRKSLRPIVIQNQQEVGLDQLSSGNLYLIQRFVSLLGQVYAIAHLNNLPYEQAIQSQGLLLIDEAENHLHPKWQKTFLNSIKKIFPNLQIILTTHSPFIVASAKDAKVFVCKSETGYSIIEEETEQFSNKPISEILVTPVFNTQPFSEEISKLIEERKTALEKGDKSEVKRIEDRLIQINPEYFSAFDIEEMIKAISNQ